MALDYDSLPRGLCTYPTCRGDLPLVRFCTACAKPAHHLCQIAFETKHALEETLENICFACYCGRAGITPVSRVASSVIPATRPPDAHRRLPIIRTTAPASVPPPVPAVVTSPRRTTILAACFSDDASDSDSDYRPGSDSDCDYNDSDDDSDYTDDPDDGGPSGGHDTAPQQHRGSGGSNGRDADCTGAGDWWREMQSADLPAVSHLLTNRDVQLAIQKWAKPWGFRPTADGGKKGVSVNMRCSCKGVLARKKVVPTCDISNVRSAGSRAAQSKEERCPFQIKAYRSKESREWKITTVVLEHNHPQGPDAVLRHLTRNQDLTEDQKRTIKLLAENSLNPVDILNCFASFYPGGPRLTTQDVRNHATVHEHRGGSTDAHNLLQRLRGLEANDHRWFVRVCTDPQGRLTHLFWMCPEQREDAVDVGQVGPR